MVSPLVDQAVDGDGQTDDKHHCPETDGSHLLHLQGGRWVNLIGEEHAALVAVCGRAAADQAEKYVSAFQRWARTSTCMQLQYRAVFKNMIRTYERPGCWVYMCVCLYVLNEFLTGKKVCHCPGDRSILLRCDRNLDARLCRIYVSVEPVVLPNCLQTQSDDFMTNQNRRMQHLKRVWTDEIKRCAQDEWENPSCFSSSLLYHLMEWFF